MCAIIILVLCVFIFVEIIVSLNKKGFKEFYNGNKKRGVVIISASLFIVISILSLTLYLKA